jgi:hypothetical protein
MRQPGNAGSNTAADHLAVIREALRQLPSDALGQPCGHLIYRSEESAWSVSAAERMLAHRLRRVAELLERAAVQIHVAGKPVGLPADDGEHHGESEPGSAYD